MAKDIKTIKVHPDHEARTIRSFQCFGWTLVNNQEIHVKDSHLERRGKSLYSVTETTHYVKLTFERDPTSLRNYHQLRQLEAAFYAIPEPQKPRELNTAGLYLGYTVFGLMALIVLLFGNLAMILIPGIPLALFAFLQYRYNEKMKAWKAAYDNCWKNGNVS